MSSYSGKASVGGCGFAPGVGKSPFKLKANPQDGRPFDRNEALGKSQGIIFLRDTDDFLQDGEIGGDRKVIDIRGLNEGQTGSSRFQLLDNGTLQWINAYRQIGRVSNIRGSNEGIRIGQSGAGEATSTWIDLSGQVRFNKYIETYLTNSAGSHLNLAKGGRWTIARRFEQLVFIVGNQQKTTGTFFPAGAWGFGAGWNVHVNLGNPPNGVTMDIGVTGDQTRFAAGLNPHSVATEGWGRSFDTYAANTGVMVTLSAPVAGGTFSIGLMSFLWLLEVPTSI